MTLKLQNTPQTVRVGDSEARVWTGTTETGIPVQCLILRVAVPEQAGERAHGLFRAELQECSAPVPDVRAFPLRMIL